MIRQAIAKIKPHYYKGEHGNKPYDLELMLRIYVLQMLYSISDMGVAAEVIDSRAFSAFCGVTSSNQVPNGDTIGGHARLSSKCNTPEHLKRRKPTKTFSGAMIDGVNNLL